LLKALKINKFKLFALINFLRLHFGDKITFKGGTENRATLQY